MSGHEGAMSEHFAEKDRTPGPDMRLAGESFCADCPDHEGCATGYPCDLVRRVNPSVVPAPAAPNGEGRCASRENDVVYPKQPRERDPHLGRPWRLDCDLVYGGDGGGWLESWSKGYRTRSGARLAAWWHYHIASWGGSVALVDQRVIPPKTIAS